MIRIEYIAVDQSCKISTDVVDKNWSQLRFQYGQISDQSEVFESAIILPWHVFISNLDILNLAVTLYQIPIEFELLTRQLFEDAQRRSLELKNYDSLPQIAPDIIQSELHARGFRRALTKEQIRNVSALSKMPYGATFSVPGAGKTTEAIAFYTLHRNENSGLLVICPKNAFPAWEEQLNLCLGDLVPSICRLTQGLEKIEQDLSSKPNSIFLITYQQFIRVVGPISKYLQARPSFVFIDESHRMKGGDRNETGRQIQRISHLPIGKLIMSGTPMPNSTADLVSQYSFLFPSDSTVDPNNVVEKIKRVYVRTTKDELLSEIDFPINTIRTEIPLNEAQKNLYDLIRSEEVRQLSGLTSRDRRLYRQLGRSYMRLLQVTTNPSLLLKSSDGFPDALREAIEYGDSNKIKYVSVKARQLAREGKKVLIWSGFVDNIESITSMLSDLGARCIHGGVEAGSDEEENTRERIIKDFHDDPNMFVLVANPAACSEGISLHTVCHHAIYLDRNYNAAQYLQSRDRIHRLGLSPGTVTTIEIVHCPNSIDDLIDSRLNVKIGRMADVLEDKSLRIEPVTVELDEEGFDEEDAKQLLIHLKSQI